MCIKALSFYSKSETPHLRIVLCTISFLLFDLRWQMSDDYRSTLSSKQQIVTIMALDTCHTTLGNNPYKSIISIDINKMVSENRVVQFGPGT